MLLNFGSVMFWRWILLSLHLSFIVTKHIHNVSLLIKEHTSLNFKIKRLKNFSFTLKVRNRENKKERKCFDTPLSLSVVSSARSITACSWLTSLAWPFAFSGWTGAQYTLSIGMRRRELLSTLSKSGLLLWLLHRRQECLLKYRSMRRIVWLEGVRVRGRLATAWGGAVRQSQDGHFTWPPHRCTYASAARALFRVVEWVNWPRALDGFTVHWRLPNTNR